MHIRDSEHLEQMIQRDTVKRLLVLSNHRKRKTVAVWFIQQYDNNLSIDAVRQMYDTTFDTVDWSLQPHLDETQIPIIQHIGLYRVTVLTKQLDGSVTVHDGESTPLDAMKGLEQ